MNQTAINMSAGAGFYKSKWVKNDPVQQVYDLEISKGFKKTAFTIGGSYRTLGAYLPDGGEKNKGFYANAGFNLGKLQINMTGRYNVGIVRIQKSLLRYRDTPEKRHPDRVVSRKYHSCF